MPQTILNNTYQFLKAKIDLLALLFCGLSIGFWVLAYAKQYYFFENGEGMDFGYNTQLLWGIIHGNLSTTNFNASFFTDHCYFIAFLVAPLYWIWPDPMLLQYLKIGMVFAGGYVFFLILRKYLHPLIALGAMIAFSLAPANISVLMGVFNYETFAIPLIFLIFKAIDDNDFKLYIICCFFLAIIKEQLPLVVMMFGVLLFFSKKENKIKWALLPFAAGLVFFIFEIFILTPYIRKDLPVTVDHYWGRYAQMGKTPHDILFFFFTHPLIVLTHLISTQNIKWYNDLFGVWGILALLSPQILLPAILLFPKSLLSSSHYEHMVLSTLWYASTFTPFIFLAAWNTLNCVQNKQRLPIHILALAFMFIHTFTDISERLWFMHPPMTNDTLAKQKFISEIPPGASVLSSWSTYVHLANRKEIYPVSLYLEGKYRVTDFKFDLPEHIDYLLLDFANEEWLNNFRKRFIPKMTTLNFDDRWRLKESIEDVALYVKNPSRQNTGRLIDRSFTPFPVKNIPLRDFGDAVILEGIDFPKNFPQKYRIFPVSMYWKCLKETSMVYQIRINIISSNKQSYYTKQRPIGSTIYPTDYWRKNEYVKENYFYLLPHMNKGDFIIKIAVFSPVMNKWIGKIEKNFSVS